MKLKGKRTILFNLVAVPLAGVAAKYGFNLGPEATEALLIAFLTLVPGINIWLRYLTTTPASLFKSS